MSLAFFSYPSKDPLGFYRKMISNEMGLFASNHYFSEEVSNCTMHRGDSHILIWFSYQEVDNIRRYTVLASLVCLYPLFLRFLRPL